MLSPEIRKKYQITIGIECHVQLKTVTKLFSCAGNDAREAAPNTLVDYIDFGLPGALPVLNAEAVHLAMRAAFAINTEPQTYSYFERKHYFYPDLPMGYQITQLHQPIVVGGHVDVEVDGQTLRVRVNRIQIEADAGKSTHPTNADYSLVDLNRAGTPLLEIVSEPDMHSAVEAKAYARELYLLMRYADVSDANLFYGNMRFDVNVSVSQNNELGTRTETKNLNSFRAVEKTVDYEINRQIELLEKGEMVVQETRGWDDAKQKTFSQRTKEDAHDYRYMPEPDVPPVVLSDARIAEVRAEMPVMPAAWRERLAKLDLDQSQNDMLLENPEAIKMIWEQFENGHEKAAKYIANWWTGPIISAITKNEITEAQALTAQSRENYLKMSEMRESDLISSTAAKEILIIAIKGQSNAVDIAKQTGKLQVSIENFIENIVEIVLRNNSKAAEDVKNGETKAIGFLVGQVMKESKGQANPSLAQELIKKRLSV